MDLNGRHELKYGDQFLLSSYIRVGFRSKDDQVSLFFLGSYLRLIDFCITRL